jgi:hypothetical protein
MGDHSAVAWSSVNQGAFTALGCAGTEATRIPAGRASAFGEEARGDYGGAWRTPEPVTVGSSSTLV